MNIWIAAKHILGYLKGTVGYNLRCTAEDGLKLQEYTDSDRARSAVDRKEHQWVLLQHRISSDILDEQEAEFCSTQYSGSEVYSSHYRK